MGMDNRTNLEFERRAMIESIQWTGRKHLPIIRQTESAECGLACLTMIAYWYGLRTDLSSLRERFIINSQGMTLQRLIECASSMKLSSRAVRLEPEDLKSLTLPCIIHWNMNHFVVLNNVKGNKFTIHDPDKGILKINIKEVSKHFTGIALELTPTHEFEQKDERIKIKLQKLTGKITGLLSSMLKIVIFAIALEILSLGSPLINQIVIDDILVASDKNLLTIIMISLILLSLTQMLLSLARQWATIKMSVNFNMQWTAKVFHHLIRLPLTWFDSRSIGSINARFNSIDDIQEALTTQVLEGILDIILVITSLVMMIIYSPSMTAIAIISAIIYGLIRAIWYPSFRQASEASWDAGAKESSHFIETINGILSLRINGVIAHRESAWLNLNVIRRNTHLHQERLHMWYDITHSLIGSMVSALILWKGASEVLNGNFTVGMLVAYLSYQDRFSSSISNLTDHFFSWKMVDIYKERLSDILLTKNEEQFEHKSNAKNIKTNDNTAILSVKNLNFNHKGSNYNLIKNISLNLNKGEILAITGKSGCGKSTLIKIILGIFQPTSGLILTLGVPHTHKDYVQVRKHIGTVLQDDQLFSGSIAENIIFFNEEINHEWMIECAKLALIDNDIMNMSMGYQTLVSENGSGLSGGQKQRIILARALYKKPLFLLLDESTSHLDVDSEIIISQSLRDLKIPVLLIAHRTETLASADRILLMENGELIET